LTEQIRTISIQDIQDALIKKWYWVTMPLIFFLLAGAWFYTVLPRSYEATTLILVQSQEIPQNYVQPTIREGMAQRVRTISQEVLSRSNLENIIKEMDLFDQQRKRGGSMDLLVSSMRSRITINTNVSGSGGTSSFSISFKGTNPKEVADVTNRLASSFIESNLKLRAQQASETTLFLQSQLDQLKILLLQQEAKVQEYRNRYLGELPDQLQSNISTLTGLQMRLESIQTSLTGAMNRRLTIQNQLSQAETGSPGTSSQRGQRISNLSAQLEEMKAKYTPEYPEIRRLQEQIAELEKQTDKTTAKYVDPHVADLRAQLSSANIEVETLRRDADRIKAEIDGYQRRVEGTPKREQEIAAITRDYNITQQNYQRLLDRIYEAKRAEDMEKRQQGEQFRVLDYAQPPQTPVSPNPRRIALVFLALGIGTGAGIIILLEILDTTIKGIKQLEGLSGNIPCIAAIPLALTSDDKRKQRLMNMMFIGINGAIFVIGAAIVLISRLSHFILNLPVPIPF